MNAEIKPVDLVISTHPKPPSGGMCVGMPRGVTIQHIPSGLVISCDRERNQHRNRDIVLGALTAALAANAPNAGAPLAQWVAEAEHLAREYGGAQHAAGTSSVTDNVEDWEGGPAKRANEARDRLFAHLAAAPAQQAGAPLPLAPRWRLMKDVPSETARYIVKHRGQVGGDAYYTAKPGDTTYPVGWSQVPPHKPTHWLDESGAPPLPSARVFADEWRAKNLPEPHDWKGHVNNDQHHCAKCGRMESDPVHQQALPLAPSEGDPLVDRRSWAERVAFSAKVFADHTASPQATLPASEAAINWDEEYVWARAEQIARDAARKADGLTPGQEYLQSAKFDNWEPHGWVVEAVMNAIYEFRAAPGNCEKTEVLDGLIASVEAHWTDGWSPIKSAPRDGTNILIRFGEHDGISQAKYIAGLPHPWQFIDTNDGVTWLINHSVDALGGPSHWRHLDAITRAQPQADAAEPVAITANWQVDLLTLLADYEVALDQGEPTEKHRQKIMKFVQGVRK